MLDVAALRAFHAERLEVLADAGPDTLALETVPCLAAAEAFALARDSSAVIAVGVNCTDPAGVPAAVRLAAQVSGKPVVVYPNSGESWDARARTWRGPGRFDARDVEGGVGAGGRLVGGCCRVTP